MEIKQFMGPFRFLSNFYPSEITHNGIAYPTVEHFYQAMKCVDKNEAFAIANAATPVQAKRMGRKVKIRARLGIHQRTNHGLRPVGEVQES